MSATCNTWAVVLTVCLGAALCGCSSPYTSEPLTKADDDTLLTPRVGLPYYLPKAYVPLTVAGTPSAGPGKPYTLNMTFANPVYTPDATSAFFLVAHHNAFSDDHFTLKTDQSGLLQSVGLQSTDQSGQVLVQLAQLAAQIATAPAALGATETPAKSAVAVKPKACTLPAYQWTDALDPSEASLAQPVEVANADKSETLIFQVAGVKAVGAPSRTITTALTTADAVYFRVPVPYKLTVVATASLQAQADCQLPPVSTQVLTVALPNGGKIFAEDISRAFSVQRTVNLTVQNGMLTSVDDTHPSEVYGFSEIPSKILSPILAIPSNLLTLHIQQMQAQGTLTAAEATLLQNQLNIINNQAALQKAAQPPAATR